GAPTEATPTRVRAPRPPWDQAPGQRTASGFPERRARGARAERAGTLGSLPRGGPPETRTALTAAGAASVSGGRSSRSWGGGRTGERPRGARGRPGALRPRGRRSIGETRSTARRPRARGARRPLARPRRDHGWRRSP